MRRQADTRLSRRLLRLEYLCELIWKICLWVCVYYLRLTHYLSASTKCIHSRRRSEQTTWALPRQKIIVWMRHSFCLGRLIILILMDIDYCSKFSLSLPISIVSRTYFGTSPFLLSFNIEQWARCLFFVKPASLMTHHAYITKCPSPPSGLTVLYVLYQALQTFVRSLALSPAKDRTYPQREVGKRGESDGFASYLTSSRFRMCFFLQARCLCCDETFLEKLAHCNNFNPQNHICESAHTIDGWPHDVPMGYDLSVPALNLHQALQEWRICSPCWSIGQHLYLPVWMRERIGQRIMYKYIP
jgi:hypothetical protein